MKIVGINFDDRVFFWLSSARFLFWCDFMKVYGDLWGFMGHHGLDTWIDTREPLFTHEGASMYSFEL